MVLGLFGRKSLAADAGLSDQGSGFRAVALAYNARSRAEVDAVLAEATSAGATLLKPAEDTFWGGYSGYFSRPRRPPLGGRLNRRGPSREDGSIRLGA